MVLRVALCRPSSSLAIVLLDTLLRSDNCAWVINE
jgi:hypothetical protein